MEQRRSAHDSLHVRHLLGVGLVLFAVAAVAGVVRAPRSSAAEGIVLQSTNPIFLASAGVDVVVRNDGPTRVDLLIRGGSLKDSSGREAASLEVAVEKATAEGQVRFGLNPTESQLVTLSLQNWDRSTLLTGVLEIVKVSGKERTVEVRRTIQVDPGADIPSGVTKWQATSYQGTLWIGSWTYHTRLPLVTGRKCPASSTANALLSTGSQTVHAKLTCNRGERYAILAFDDFPTVGSYTGKFVTSSGSLEVSVRRSTIWVDPTVLALLGLILAGLRAWWLDKRRNLVRYEERVDDVVRLAGRSHNAFKITAAGRPWGNYDVRPAVVAWAQAWRQRLRDPDVDENVFAELRTDAGRLAGRLARWQSASAAFSRLPAASADVPSEVNEFLPQLERNILKAAAGSAPLATIDDLAFLLDDATGYQGTVIPTAQRLAKHNRLVRDNPSFPDASNQQVFIKAVQRIRRVIAKAGTVKHIDGLTPVVAELDGIDDQLRLLPPMPQVTAAAMAGAAVAPDDKRNEEQFAAALSRAFSRRASRITADLASFALAAAVAVFSALSQLYVGKAWGTWFDQVAIFFWAFGATALLNDVLQGLLRLIERQSASTGA